MSKIKDNLKTGMTNRFNAAYTSTDAKAWSNTPISSDDEVYSRGDLVTNRFEAVTEKNKTEYIELMNTMLKQGILHARAVIFKDIHAIEFKDVPITDGRVETVSNGSDKKIKYQIRAVTAEESDVLFYGHQLKFNGQPLEKYPMHKLRFIVQGIKTKRKEHE